MRVASRFIAIPLTLLLAAQAAWAVPVCDAAMTSTVVPHSMDASHHSGKPAPSGHHVPCQSAVCVTMAACGPLAVTEPAQAPAPGIARATLPPVSQPEFLPSGRQPPDPPPPRA
jgi:hypothetical protein